MHMAAMPKTIALGDRRFTRVGLGTNRLTDTEADRSFLTAGVEAGLEFIDTAHLYSGGESELAIGAALAPFAEHVVVATKGNFLPGGGSDGLRAELELSLERLRTEVIDLYYLHRVDPGVPLEETMNVLKEYRDAGRIAHVGLSEVSVAEIERARSIVPISAVQNEFNLTERMHDEVVDFCASEGIVFVPFFPLQGDSPNLAEIAANHDAAPDQIKLAWLLRRSEAMAPIPGTRSLEHLRMNLDALDIELSPEEFETLSAT
jgi:aryl-alcohol dehydrogenase-like predicted oxidoreductase